MPVKESKRTWQAEDGTEFDSKDAAEKYDRLSRAKLTFECAKVELCRALAETQKTADGLPFEFGVWLDYWYIRDCFGFPALCRVDFIACHGNRDFVLHDDGSVSLVNTRAEGRAVEFRISDLYRHEGNAKKALLAAQNERLAELSRDVAKLEKEIS